jgi:hypothetical protein
VTSASERLVDQLANRIGGLSDGATMIQSTELKRPTTGRQAARIRKL